MRRLLPIVTLLLSGCSGMAVSLTYTPPMTFGLTIDARPIYPVVPTTQVAK